MFITYGAHLPATLKRFLQVEICLLFFHRYEDQLGASMEQLTPRDFYLAGPEVESPDRYQPGGYHPVHLGDVYHQRYRVIHKLGFGTYSTVWLARDLQSSAQT